MADSDEGQERTNDAGQVLDVLRDVLLQHMDRADFLPCYRIARAVEIGRDSGRFLADDDVISGRDTPSGLLLTMGDGTEYRLTLEAED